mgnify:CR=1 FL=1
MKRKKMPSVDEETLIPLLLSLWRRLHKLPGPSDRLQTREFRSVVEAIRLMQAGQGGNLVEKNFLGASLLYYWWVYYQEGLSLLQEVPSSFRKVLDISGGLGPFSFAALKHGAEDVLAVDLNPQGLAFAKEIAGKYGFVLRTLVQDPRRSTPAGSFDLVIAAHCQEKMFSTLEERVVWVESLAAKLHPSGHLLLVESSLQESNQPFLALRDVLVERGFPVQAPCVWKGVCPARQSQTPCYAQREFVKPYLIQELQRGAEIRLSSLKMSYLLLKPKTAVWSDPPKALYRVISPPLEGLFGRHFYLCGTDGKKSLSSALTETPPGAKAFDFLKRGELLSVEGVQERGNRLELTEESRIQIEAALGKPYTSSTSL